MPLTQDQARTKIRELVEKYRAMTTDARKGITEAGVVHQFLIVGESVHAEYRKRWL